MRNPCLILTTAGVFLSISGPSFSIFAETQPERRPRQQRSLAEKESEQQRARTEDLREQGLRPEPGVDVEAQEEPREFSDLIRDAVAGGYTEASSEILLNRVVTLDDGTEPSSRGTVQYQIGTVDDTPVFVRVDGDLSRLETALEEIRDGMTLRGRPVAACSEEERICTKTCRGPDGPWCCRYECQRR